jgi:tetraacyldisaccharide 4'-kinase
MRFPSYFVVSVGNLTWGGTGKTSMIAQLANRWVALGIKTAIVSRGYGRNTRGLRFVRPDDDWQETGDEPAMLAKLVPGATVVVAEDRAAGISSLADHQPQVILLDDAYQHRAVGRNVDVVMIDASEDLARGGVIPFGKLREPVSGLSRGNIFVLVHSNPAHSSTIALLSRFAAPKYHARYCAINFREWQGKNAAAFCGLGSPQHFFRMLRDTGAELVLSRPFPDHHRYERQELDDLASAAQRSGAQVLLTTAKDAVKIQHWNPLLPVIVVQAELEFEEGDEIYRDLQNRFEKSAMVTR